MGKRRKPPGSSQDGADQTKRSDSSTSEHEAQRDVGNQAILDQLRDRPHDQGPRPEPTRQATQLVERALLALEVRPRPKAEHDRYLQILNKSGLPADRKRLLTDHLERHQTSALDISQALRDSFGRDTDEIRGMLTSALDAVWSDLDRGASPQDAATDQVIDDLFGSHSTSSGSASSFCRAVFFALDLDEEEDEAADDWSWNL